MGKFIELHDQDGPVLINIDYIEAIWPSPGDHCGIRAHNMKANFEPEENYSEVRRLIAVAQGGIPMHRDRTVEGAPG